MVFHSGIPDMTPEDLQQDFEDNDSVFTITVYGGFNFTWVTTTDYTLILMWVSRLHPILGSLTTIVDG